MAIFAKDGKALPRGSMLVQADLANTLESIRQQGPDAFYKGRIAEQIVAAVRGFFDLTEKDRKYG
jgi:gamma-glutamyltranspeptidase/glutathione hydrolase